MNRIGFFIEQALGHKTHGENLRKNLCHHPSIDADWGLPAWEVNGLASQLPVFRSNWTVRAGIRTRRILAEMNRKHPLDALFFHTQVTAVLAQDWMRRIPSVVSLDATPRQYDSLGEFYAHPSGPAWLEQLKWRMNKSCFRTAEHLVAWSEWAKNGLVDEYDVPPEKVTVIPPGVDTEFWKNPQPRPQSEDKVKILFVGGNLKRKGGLVLMEAFRRLRREGFAELELHLVTNDPAPQEEGLFGYYDLQPNSLELKQLYHSSDIFCLPTYGDCLPMVLSEAGAAGLPMISTQVAAIPEIVREGETGFLVPPADVEALAHALKTLIQNPNLREKYGNAAEKIVRAEHDANKNAGQLVSLLQDMINVERQHTAYD